MHILLIHQIFVTPDEGGGTRHYEMCKYLVEQGHQVSVIASDTDYLSGHKRNITEEIKDGIRIYYAPTTSNVHKSILSRALNFFSFSFNAYKLGKQLNNIDIVWGTTPPLFQAFSASLLAKRQRVLFLLEIRDLWLDFARQLGIVTNKLLYHFFKLIEKYIYRKAGRIIVNSPGFIPYINKIVSKDNIEVFANGVDIKDFSATSKTAVAEFKKGYGTEDKFVVMYTGNIGIANDIENILNAAKSLIHEYPAIQFLFIGGGLNTKRYKNQANNEKLSNVQFIDSQAKKEMPNILAVADVCLATLKNIPLFKTNYPNKVFDYMAAGKPTILAIDGVMRKVVEKAEGGQFVAPGDSEALKEAILFYFHHRDRAGLQGRNARKYVAQHFDRKEITFKFGKYLESLIQ